jgi:hypothetical protein
MIRAIVIVLALVFFSGGCGGEEQSGGIRAPRTTEVTEQAAIDIATNTVSERDGWSDMTGEAAPMGNGWEITVTRGGAGAGDVRIVILDGEGAVSMYQEG